MIVFAACRFARGGRCHYSVSRDRDEIMKFACCTSTVGAPCGHRLGGAVVTTLRRVDEVLPDGVRLEYSRSYGGDSHCYIIRGERGENMGLFEVDYDGGFSVVASRLESPVYQEAKDALFSAYNATSDERYNGIMFRNA